MHQLSFSIRHHFRSAKGGLLIPVQLAFGSTLVDCEAKIDTGADYCLFERALADSLELELESGHLMVMESLTGSFVTYGHEITLQTFDLAFNTTVYFAADNGITRNLLGRNGWLNLVLFGLDTYDEVLYLNAYDELTT